MKHEGGESPPTGSLTLNRVQSSGRAEFGATAFSPTLTGGMDLHTFCRPNLPFQQLQFRRLLPRGLLQVKPLFKPMFCGSYKYTQGRRMQGQHQESPEDCQPCPPILRGVQGKLRPGPLPSHETDQLRKLTVVGPIKQGLSDTRTVFFLPCIAVQVSI